jgi:hypothetical protein
MNLEYSTTLKLNAIIEILYLFMNLYYLFFQKFEKKSYLIIIKIISFKLILK